MNTNLQLTENLVFLLERAESNLTVEATGNKPNDYILEGIAAIMGEENNNHRIYEAKEYLPHLEYLNKKIAQKRLVGELDHPEKFDVSLKSISHIVEKLDYNEKDRTLRIRVRLLDTPHGQIAKTLVDAGYPLSISSRAAGSVMENKKVKIKKIFTYDLVADPGFEKAQLDRIYESANYDVDTKKSVVSELTDISESFGSEFSAHTKIYSVDPNNAAFKKAMLEDDKKTNNDMNQFVTSDELNDWSAAFRTGIMKEIENVKSKVTESTDAETIKTLLERIEKHERYMKYLAGNIDKNIQYTEYVAENLDKNIEYSKYIAENLDRNISYAEYLAENLDRGISFMDYLAENLEKNINYSEYLAENLDKNISYAEYLAENLDKNISYSEYLAENLDKNISYSEYLAENLDKSITYGEYLAENIDRGIGYSEYLAEKIENNIAYAEYIAENVVTAAPSVEATPAATNNIETAPVTAEATPAAAATETNTTATANANAPIAKVNENVDEASKYTGLSAQISQLLETATKQKAVTKMNESQYHFFRFLGEAKRSEFEALEEAKKEKVANALKPGAYFSEADVTKIWEAALIEKQDNTPKFLQMIPEAIKPLYEALSEKEKQGILAQSNLMKLETEYQIKNFWTSRPFARGKVVGLVKLNENETAAPATTDKSKSLGYGTEYMDGIANQLSRRFKK